MGLGNAGGSAPGTRILSVPTGLREAASTLSRADEVKRIRDKTPPRRAAEGRLSIFGLPTPNCALLANVRPTSAQDCHFRHEDGNHRPELDDRWPDFHSLMWGVRKSRVGPRRPAEGVWSRILHRISDGRQEGRQKRGRGDLTSDRSSGSNSFLERRGPARSLSKGLRRPARS